MKMIQLIKGWIWVCSAFFLFFLQQNTGHISSVTGQVLLGLMTIFFKTHGSFDEWTSIQAALGTWTSPPSMGANQQLRMGCFEGAATPGCPLGRPGHRGVSMFPHSPFLGPSLCWFPEGHSWSWRWMTGASAQMGREVFLPEERSGAQTSSHTKGDEVPLGKSLGKGSRRRGWDVKSLIGI